jgi:hypothetical protein
MLGNLPEWFVQSSQLFGLVKNQEDEDDEDWYHEYGEDYISMSLYWRVCLGVPIPPIQSPKLLNTYYRWRSFDIY